MAEIIEPPRLNAIVPYFGSKRAMATEILDIAIGDWQPDMYIEPFHGSLAMLLAARRRGVTCPAIANDLFELVSSTAIVMSTEHLCEQLISEMAALPCSERIYERACDVVEQHLAVKHSIASVQIVKAFLIASWLGRNGENAIDGEQLKRSFAIRWTDSGGGPAKRWRSVIKSLPTWYKLLCENTTFLCRDFDQVLAKVANDQETFIYCDPPYLRSTRSGKYAIEFEDGTGGFFAHDDDHARLADALDLLTKPTIAVSYYAHERLAELYPPSKGWVHHDLSRTKLAANQSPAEDAVEAPEVLIVRNGRGKQ